MAPKAAVEWSTQRWPIVFFGLVLYLDLVASCLQYVVLEDYLADFWNPMSFFYDMMYFNSSTADVVILSMIRLTSIPLLLYISVRVGSPLLAIQDLVKSKVKVAKENLRRGVIARQSVRNYDIRSSDMEEAKFFAQQTNEVINVVESDDESPQARPAIKVELSEKEKRNVKQNAELRKNLFQGAMFILLSACQIHVGIKSIVYPFDGTLSPRDYIVAATSIASLVAWTNAELFLARNIADELTKDIGEMFPDLHLHPLFYEDSISGQTCDNCKTRRLKEAFRCVDCKFNLCLDCAKSKNKTKDRERERDVLRGEGGAIREREISNWEYVKRGLLFASPHTFMVFLALLMMLLASGANLVLPHYQGKILDNVIQQDYIDFYLDIKLFLAFSAAVGLFGGIRNLCFNIIGQQMQTEIRDVLFTSVMTQDIAFFDGTTTGDMTSRLSQDTYAMTAPTRSLLSTTLSSVLYLIGGLAMCLYTSWRLSVLAFTTIGPVILIYRVYSKWSRQINKDIWAAYGDASALATQAISNIRTVRAFGTEAYEERSYQVATKEALKKGIKDAYAGAGAYALTNYIDLGISVLLLWYGGTVVMAEDGRLSVGNLITFQLYWGMINNAYNNLSDLLTQYTRAGGAAQRVLNLMDHRPDIDPTAGEILTALKGEVKLESVKFAYQMRPDQLVLKDVNLNIDAGKTLALVGRSGGGKSTIVHLILRFYLPQAGRITIDGWDLAKLNAVEYRKFIGIVAQDTQLFNCTIEENIAYGLDNYSKKELLKAAKLANAHDFISRFEEGYQTKVGERGVRMSGGQKQRIAIARAFLRKPKILLLDEATSALDTESEALVQEAIDNLIKNSGCTVILVAHRLSTVINADKIAVIDKGVVMEQGRHEELVKKGGVYANLVSRQLARMQNTLDQGKDPSKEKVDVIDKLIDELTSQQSTPSIKK